MVYAEFDRLKEDDAKNCKKGVACGNSCIARGKKCKQNLGAKAAAIADHLSDPANLEKGAESSDGESENVEPSLTDKFPQISSSEVEMFEKETEIGDNIVKTTIADDSFQTEPSPPPIVQIVGIEINGGYDKSSNIEREDALKLAFASRRHVREYVKAVPEGTVLSNTPHTKDGFGDQRAKLYERAGFSPPNKDNVMYSIVSGGKNIPITLEEINALKEAGHIK